MGNIYDLMLEEARSNFFQFENLISNLDVKAFGVVAIDAILLSAFVSILSSWKPTVPAYYYVPSLFLVVSLVFMTFCIWPRTWKRQNGEKIISKYGTFNPEDAAGQLAVNYAQAEMKLAKTYDIKLRFFETGLVLTVIAFPGIIMILSNLFSS